MSSPHGPQPGATPQGDSDLHTSDNPHSTGAWLPNVIFEEPSAYAVNNGGQPGYYVPLPNADPNNPNAQGAGSYSQQEQVLSRGDTLGDSLEQDLMSRDPQSAPQPSMGDYWKDFGYGSDGEGRS
jgi:hypothetical protein